MTDEEIFKLFITPALDEAVRLNKRITFSYNPSEVNKETGELSKEWMYLSQKYGYSLILKEGEEWVLKKK